MVIRATTYGTGDHEHGGVHHEHPRVSLQLMSQRMFHIQDMTRPTGQIALSDRMDEWISKHNTLIMVARERQSKTDHHALVEYDPAVTEYPINSYVFFTPPVCRSDKQLQRHRGPYQVLVKSHSIYVIEDLVNDKRSAERARVRGRIYQRT